MKQVWESPSFGRWIALTFSILGVNEAMVFNVFRDGTKYSTRIQWVIQYWGDRASKETRKRVYDGLVKALSGTQGLQEFVEKEGSITLSGFPDGLPIIREPLPPECVEFRNWLTNLVMQKGIPLTMVVFSELPPIYSEVILLDLIELVSVSDEKHRKSLRDKLSSPNATKEVILRVLKLSGQTDSLISFDY